MFTLLFKMTFAVLVCSSLHGKQPDAIALIDLSFKKPVAYTEQFKHEQYFERLFPLVSSDVEAVSEASVQVAKMLNKGTGCNRYDTIFTNNTYFLVHTACGDLKTVSVNLLSNVNGQVYALQLLKREQDMRVAQRKLLDFSGYLSR